MKTQVTHCICMVTYNHEKWIRQALDSIFDNEVLPDKVILFDDCSTDNTWNIVQEYETKYQSILQCKKNEKNLGIFGNINQTWQAGIDSGCDILSWCSGDDYLKKGLLQEFNNMIEKEHIDIKNEKFILITDTEELYPDGKTKVFSNYKYRNCKDKLYLRLQGKLNYRECGYSRKTAMVPPFREDIGLWADLIHSIDLEQNCDNFYYSNFVGTVYRCGVGTVSKEKQLKLYQSRVYVDEYIKNTYKLSNKAKLYLNLDYWYHKTLIERKVTNYAKLSFYLLSNINNWKLKYFLIFIPKSIKNIGKSIINKSF